MLRFSLLMIGAVRCIYSIFIVCKHSDARPVHKNFITSTCNFSNKNLIGISINRIKFNESTIITCASCNYYPTMYLFTINTLIDFKVYKTNQTQNSIQKVGKIYYYQFNYTSLSDIYGYLACHSKHERSFFALIEKSTDKQLKLRAWRKSYPNYSFPDRNRQYEFILYIEHRFNVTHSNIWCEIISNNFYQYVYLTDYTNDNFRYVLSISNEYNLYVFYIRIYAFDHLKIYKSHDTGDTYVGFANVLDYDKYIVESITKEAEHMEL